MEFDRGLATFLAAVIAAIVSLITLFTTLPKEMRAANRKTLEPHIDDISDSVHQIIAISNILLKTKSPESKENWSKKAEIHKVKLKEIRPKVRYSLWKIDKYIQSLTRLSDYTLYTLDDSKTVKKLLYWGNLFGNKVDQCIRYSYVTGKSPWFYNLWLLRFYNYMFKKVRNDYKAKRNVS